jgi:2-oxoglutarate dehydrogenase E1 component
MSSVAFGANIAFIEELYEKYRSDPSSVSASWREFFADYDGGVVSASSRPSVPPPPEVGREAHTTPPRPTPVPAPKPGQNPVALRGAASKIVANMETSLTVPTATSVRNIPVKALEENRRVINNHLALQGQSKASFTHVIAWALVKALKEHPRMNSSFTVVDGVPTRIDRDDVRFSSRRLKAHRNLE